jgi:hypothetical protein
MERKKQGSVNSLLGKNIIKKYILRNSESIVLLNIVHFQ